VEFRILGELEVIGEAGPIELKAAKQRALLAILLLRANEVVSADSLVDRLWNERPPRSAPKLVQVYVSQLRRALGEGVIVTRPPGYALELAQDDLDAARFERLLAEGRATLAAGNAARARRTLGEALGLWRGAALADLAYEEFASAEAERLEELRRSALEERIEADLALGRHDHLVPELRALVDRYPLRERLHRQTMLALYRSGRQAEALECFADARRTLDEELGLEPGEELRRLQAAILRQDESLALERPVDTRLTNVPAPVTPLRGREAELAEVIALVRREDARLVTLSGPGGAGKTRLAVEVAHAVLEDFANGVFLIELAPLASADMVPGAIASALGIPPTAGETPHDTLVRRLRGEELLLVVDNAEHLPAIGPLLRDLLAAAPRLKLLVTGRSVLNLSGEHVFWVPPLRPEPAAELFLAAAQAADPQSVPGAEDAELVAEICARLDHLPLAIELAAPRLRTLSLASLHERLAHRLPLLTGGSRDLPTRQQTLRDTLDWSYGLLDEPARRLLAALGVFAGGFTLESAENVCAGGSTQPVLDGLTTLLDASLVRQRSRGARFELLETIREYALERLDALDEAEAIRRRHAEDVLRIAESANLNIEAEGEMRHELVIPERDNIRAALDWALAAGEYELGLRIAAALENYWLTSSPVEGKLTVGALLEQARDVPGELRARALRAQGSAAVGFGEYEEGQRLLEASLAEYRRLGDERGMGIVLQRVSGHAIRRGETAQVRTLTEEGLRLHEKLGFRKGEAVGLGWLGLLELRDGNEERGLELVEQAIDLAAETGFTFWQSRLLAELAGYLLERGHFAAAEERARRALALAGRMADRQGTITALAQLARVAGGAGDPGRAGTLWGAIEAEEARGRIGSWEDQREAVAAAVLAYAGPGFDAGYDEGRRLSLADAVEYAGADTATSPPRSPATP
jgi:predicted ATPase/DNA-binding SARP family transcriptional activator